MKVVRNLAISCLILMFVCAKCDENKSFAPASDMGILKSDPGTPLELQDAKNMMKDYKVHPGRLTTKLCTPGPDRTVLLNGFKIRTDILVDLLWPGIDIPISQYEEIMLMPSVRAQDTAETNFDNQYLTIIIGRIENQKIDIQAGGLIDYFDPCPDKCPNNFEEIAGYDPDYTNFNPTKCGDEN